MNNLLLYSSIGLCLWSLIYFIEVRVRKPEKYQPNTYKTPEIFCYRMALFVFFWPLLIVIFAFAILGHILWRILTP